MNFIKLISYGLAFSSALIFFIAQLYTFNPFKFLKPLPDIIYLFLAFVITCFLLILVSIWASSYKDKNEALIKGAILAILLSILVSFKAHTPISQNYPGLPDFSA